jgi:hypothetical protein
MRWHPVPLVLSFLLLTTTTACTYEDTEQFRPQAALNASMSPPCSAGKLQANIEPIIKFPYVYFHWLITLRNSSGDNCTLPVRPSVAVSRPDGGNSAADDALLQTDLRENQSERELHLAPGQRATARIWYDRTGSNPRACLRTLVAGFQIRLSAQDDVIQLQAPAFTCLSNDRVLAVTAFVPGST